MAENVSERARLRRQTAVVKEYLAYLATPKPRGRLATPSQIQEQLTQVSEAAASTEDPLKKMELIQRKLDLEQRLAETSDPVSVEELEQQFVEVAREFADRKGFSYQAFRQLGVPPRVLKAAGFKETRSRRS